MKIFSSIRDFLIKKFFVSFVIENLDKAFKYIGKDGSKTIVGALIAVFGVLITQLPGSAPFVQPVIDYLKTLPAEEIIAGGLVYQAIGLFHKAVKSIKEKVGLSKK